MITHVTLQTITRPCSRNYLIKTKNSYTLTGGQLIDRYSIYADQKHNLTNNWGIGYGVAYRYAKDYDFQTYNNVTGNIQTENTEAKLNEQTASFLFFTE